MGVRELEAQILAEARTVFGNTALRQKDLLEWSTGLVKEQEGEVTAFLPDIKVWVAVPQTCDKRKK